MSSAKLRSGTDGGGGRAWTIRSGRGCRRTTGPSTRSPGPARFEARVREAPEAIAVVCEEQSLTYAQLDARADRLARRLRARGVGVEDVGVAVPRTAEMVVALLGVMKAGAAYLPLDLDHPGERIAFMLRDSNAEIVVTTEALAGELPALDRIDRVLLGTAQSEAALAAGDDDELDDGDRAAAGSLDRAAYVIDTSGSTSTLWLAEPGRTGQVPIGIPDPNTRAYVSTTNCCRSLRARSASTSPDAGSPAAIVAGRA